MFKRQSDQRLVELEIENKLLKSEIETLKYENAELRETNSKRKQSQASSGTADCSELQRELIQQLSETRKQLLNVQDRLTVAEQVTAATQRRELVQEGVYQNLPADSEYEELRFDPTQEHVYAKLQLPTHTGSDVLRTQYSKLSTELDAHTVAVHMYQHNALTLKELQSIQSLTDRPVQAAETLLNIIVEQPDAIYLCFLDVLKHTEQHHVYQTLVEAGYKGEKGY